MHVASLTGAAPTPRETQQSVPGAAPSIPEATHHQSPSADSLTEATAVPAIGEHVHYNESELMRMTANALEAAASHTRQASVGAADATGQMLLSSDGRFSALPAVAFPQLDQQPTSSWLRERSSSQPVSSLIALPNLRSAEEGERSGPTTPTVPSKPAHVQPPGAQESVSMRPSNTSQRSFAHVATGQPDVGKSEGAARESSDGGMSFRDMLAGTSETAPDDATVSRDRQDVSLASSSDAGSPRTDEEVAAAAAALWPSTVTGVDHAAGDRPESPSAMARRRSSRAGSKQLQTISEAENESS